MNTVAATRAAVIFNSSETSGPRSNGRILKMYILEVYIKSFGGQKGVRSNPLEPPLPTGLRMGTTLSLIFRRLATKFSNGID